MGDPDVDGLTALLVARPPGRAVDAIRQHPRFRVVQARALRGVLSRAAVVLSLVSITGCAPLLWLYPQEGAALVVVSGVEATAWAVIAVLTRRLARRYLAPLAACFALLVLFGPWLTIALLPAQHAMAMAYLAIIPLAVGLFVPWSSHAHHLWLLVVVAVAAGVAASPLTASLPRDDRLGLVVAIGTASLLSFFGQGMLEQTRLLEFAERMRLRDLGQQARTAYAEIEHLNGRLLESARRDPLTGVANRLRLMEDLPVQWDRHVRYGHPFAVAMLDLDHFKELNDRHGHLAGDAALRAVARALGEATRAGDVVYRWGGEEFLVLLPEASETDAQAVAERLRQAVVALAIPNSDNIPWGVTTASVGVAVASRGTDGNADDLVRRADNALYRSKERGRNRVEA